MTIRTPIRATEHGESNYFHQVIQMSQVGRYGGKHLNSSGYWLSSGRCRARSKPALAHLITYSSTSLLLPVPGKEYFVPPSGICFSANYNFRSSPEPLKFGCKWKDCLFCLITFSLLQILEKSLPSLALERFFRGFSLSGKGHKSCPRGQLCVDSVLPGWVAGSIAQKRHPEPGLRKGLQRGLCSSEDAPV